MIYHTQGYIFHNDWTTGETERLKLALARGWSLHAAASIVDRTIEECARKRDRLVEQGFLIPNGGRYVIA